MFFLLCYISSRTEGLDVHVNWYTMANEVPEFIFVLNAQKMKFLSKLRFALAVIAMDDRL